MKHLRKVVHLVKIYVSLQHIIVLGFEPLRSMVLETARKLLTNLGFRSRLTLVRDAQLAAAMQSQDNRLALESSNGSESLGPMIRTNQNYVARPRCIKVKLVTRYPFLTGIPF